MTDKPVTGEEGRALIRGRVLDAVYVMQPPYPNAIGRIAKTYEALGDGPKDGHHLFQHGNLKPKTNQRMSEKDFRDHLRNVVLEERLHVLPIRDWPRYRAALPSTPVLLPSVAGEEEFEGYLEGKVEIALVNRFERDRRNRDAAIARHGTRCFGCDREMQELYGEIAKGFIHVHHVQPLSRIGGPTKANLNNLVPLCPNRHAVVHLKSPPLSIAELRRLVV